MYNLSNKEILSKISIAVNLYPKLLQQLNKDIGKELFLASHRPENLLRILQSHLEQNPSQLGRILYTVDVSENTAIQSGDFEELSQQILIREIQKVQFRHQFSS